MTKIKDDEDQEDAEAGLPSLEISDQPLEALVNEAHGFIYPGQNCQLFFRPRGPKLLVSFDNLTMVDEGFPREPWLSKYASQLGYSILGIQAYEKDWFRNSNPQDLLQGLNAVKFFEKFERILVTGTSMGGFAALCFGHMIKGAHVAAFSPQSSLNQDLVPADQRFLPAKRKFDWTTPPFHDAAQNLHRLEAATIFYDPYLPEDIVQCVRLHAHRITHYKLPFFDHALPRLIAKCGALSPLIESLMDQGQPSAVFFEELRKRRGIRIWNRRFIEHLEATGSYARREKVAEFMRKTRPDYGFAVKKSWPDLFFKPPEAAPERFEKPLPLGIVPLFWDEGLSRDEDIFRRGAVETRLNFFFDFWLPALRAQQDKCFEIALFCHANLPDAPRARLKAVVRGIPQVKFIFSDDKEVDKNFDDLVRATAEKSEENAALIFNLSPRFLMGQSFIQEIKREAEALENGAGLELICSNRALNIADARSYALSLFKAALEADPQFRLSPSLEIEGAAHPTTLDAKLSGFYVNAISQKLLPHGNGMGRFRKDFPNLDFSSLRSRDLTQRL